MDELEDKTYELCYNSACILLSKGNYTEALEKLYKAEDLCKKSFEDDPDDQEALENEIAIIKYSFIKINSIDLTNFNLKKCSIGLLFAEIGPNR